MNNEPRFATILVFSVTAMHPVGAAQGYMLYVITWSDGIETQPILIVPPPDWSALNPLAGRQEVAIAVFECDDACLIGHPMIPYHPAPISAN